MTRNKKIIYKLAQAGVFETKKVKDNTAVSENDVIIVDEYGEKEKVIFDETMSNEELLLMIGAEKVATLKSIRKMMVFFTALTVIGIVASVIWALYLFN